MQKFNWQKEKQAGNKKHQFARIQPLVLYNKNKIKKTTTKGIQMTQHYEREKDGRFNNCCLKALKHHEYRCPVCNQLLIPFEPQRQLAIKFNEKQK